MESATHKHIRLSMRRAGFSLIELMVVIVIIGVLGATAVVIYKGIVGDAKSARASDEIKQIAQAVSQYQIKKGNYPESLEALADMQVKTPEADPWGNPYLYTIVENGFSIVSGGEKPGEEDDIFWDPEKQKVVDNTNKPK